MAEGTTIISKAHSEALRRRWQDPAYRAKAMRRKVNPASVAVTARIVQLYDEGLAWKDIAAQTHLCVAAVRRRYDHARIAELEAELARRDEVQRKAVLG